MGHFREDYYRIKVEHELLQDEHTALTYRHQENLLRYQGLEDTLTQMGKQREFSNGRLSELADLIQQRAVLHQDERKRI